MMRSFRSTAVSTFTVLAFVAGTVGIPTVHLAFHSLPHDHAGGGVAYHLGSPFPPVDVSRPPVHRHDANGNDVIEFVEQAGPQNLHTHPVDVDGTEGPQPAGQDHKRQPFDPQHGEGSAAHFAVAVSDAPAHAIILGVFGDVPILNLGRSTERRIRLELPSPHLDRGPPLLELL